LEETMAEQINIIESMNRRQKSFMEGQDELKKNLMIRIQRLENDFISKTFEALDQKFDFKHFEQTVKKLQGDMDVFRVDFLTFKEVNVGKMDNIDIIFKKVANESFNKVREVESELGMSKFCFITVNYLVKNEFMKLTNESIKETATLYEKLGQIQNEIIEIKNEKKALTNLRSKVHWASDASQKVEALVEETNNLYFMIQRFIDEHATDRIKLLRQQETNLKEKMNVMDWLSRNSDFLSADPIQECILAFKELYNTDNATLKNAYIFAKHSSNVVQTVMVLLEQY
jgi:predicted nuclease with TOPRIM domain